MNDACFLAPIHKAKFDFGLDLIKSYNTHFDDDHIYLVFSSHEERREFAIIDEGLKYRTFIMPDQFNHQHSPTTLKKYFGLEHVFNSTNFKYIGCIDVDTLFFKFKDYDKLFYNYYQRGVIYGGDYKNTVHADWFIGTIVTSGFKFFKEEEVNNLVKAIGYVYFWFNDIPVYEKKHFLDFLDHINLAQNKNNFTWYDFDFIIYAYYLIIKGIWRVLPIKVDGKDLKNLMIEEQWNIPEDIFEAAYVETEPMWIYKKIREDLMKNTFMLVHVDRKI